MNFGNCAVAIKDTFFPTEASKEAYVGLEHIEPNTLRVAGHSVASSTISQKLKFRKGDILFGKLRPYFRKVALARFDGVCSTDFWVVRAKNGFDQNFLFYLMASQEFVDFVNQASEGTRMPRAKWSYAENFTFPDIGIDEQKAIAKILSAFDDKIEVNRRMNATLEAMARALFKAWFVDFEPVHANRENRPSTSASPEIAKLFPSDFENNIPKGWRLGSVSDLGEVVCGKTPSTKIADNFGDEIPFITIPDMHGKAIITKTVRCLSKKGADSQHKKYLPAKSICVSCIATAGLVSMTSESSQTNQQINSVIPKGRFCAYFCYQVLNKLGQEIRTKGSGGSVFVNLNTGSFSRIPILLPDETISTSYDNITKPLFERILINEKENHCLSEMRDSLLPRLISGRTQVNQ